MHNHVNKSTIHETWQDQMQIISKMYHDLSTSVYIACILSRAILKWRFKFPCSSSKVFHYLSTPFATTIVPTIYIRFLPFFR